MSPFGKSQTWLCALILCSLLISRADAQLNLGFSASVCRTDSEASPEQRAEYEKPAMQFVETILGNQPGDAYADMVDKARESVQLEDFTNAIQQQIWPFRPFVGLHVEHSYRVSQFTVGSRPTMVFCSVVADGNTSLPKDRISVVSYPVPLQAYVIIEGKAKNNTFGFIFMLSPGQQGWQVDRFDFLPLTILDRTAGDLWKLARQEQQKGHAFNAYLLYATTAQAAVRGPNIHLGVEPEIAKEMAALEAPAELRGKPPFEWKFLSGTYRIASVGPLGVGNAFDLQVVQLAAQGDDQELDRQNHALIAAFQETHPDYHEVFDALIVRAVRPDGSGFTTVEPNKSGP